MRIAFVTAEVAPYAHVGGLGDVSRWLPATLAEHGDDVRVFLPRYEVLDTATRAESVVPGLENLDLGPLGTAAIHTLDGPGPTILLVDAAEWFSGNEIYSSGPKEHLRYAVFGRAVLAACDAMGWTPDVLHVNDWHTALLPLHADARGGPWPEVPVVLTVHNLSFQGWFPSSDLKRLGLDPKHPAIEDDPRGVNSLRTGIRAAEMVTTVSPTYANEILTPERGEGLDDVLRDRRADLVGVLNGIGTEWDPSDDPHLPASYGPSTLDLKAASTDALRDRLGLAHPDDVPVLGVVSRLTMQKGFELLRHTLPPLLEAGAVQLAVIGTGDPTLEAMFDTFAKRFPADAGYHRSFDNKLAHLIQAGSDIFLMPSEWEPCGLNQMYSQRYGTIPVVHRTGGLADTVKPWNPGAGEGTGFLFERHNDEGFSAALSDALEAFDDQEAWRQLQRNGMAEDFSWERRAGEYQDIYRRVLRT